MDLETDDRVPCKYGVNCYQKNELHRQKYKHGDSTSTEVKSPPKKKTKVETDGDHEQRGAPSASEATTAPEAESSARATNEEASASVEALSSGDAPASPQDVKESIKQKFLVDMPDEFYSFWELCKTLNKDKPQDALACCNLKLVGPFDVLSGSLRGKALSADQYLRHWRYFYDPPEFQTVLRGDDKTQFHIGYFRDVPEEPPAFVGSNCAVENCVIKNMGPNLFAAVDSHLNIVLKTADPFLKLKVKKIQGALQACAKKNDILLVDKAAVAARNRKTVCQTFHKAGIVVPYNKTTTIGYRSLETDPKLRKLLDAIAEAATEERRDHEMEELDLLINNANIANDECDFGCSLELGLNLFLHGHSDFQGYALRLLRAAYSLLNRQAFYTIIQAHLKDRKKGANLSIID